MCKSLQILKLQTNSEEVDDKIKEHAKPIIDYLDYCRIWW